MLMICKFTKWKIKYKIICDNENIPMICKIEICNLRNRNPEEDKPEEWIGQLTISLRVTIPSPPGETEARERAGGA